MTLWLVACGGGAPRSATGQDTVGKPNRSSVGPIVRVGRLAGRLIVQPGTVKPGTRVGLALENEGSVPLYYGLGGQVEQRVGGEEWRSLDRTVFGAHQTRVRGVLLRASPGTRAGPDYRSVSDELLIPRTLRRGEYRVVKRVRGGGRSPGGLRATLTTTFTIR